MGGEVCYVIWIKLHKVQKWNRWFHFQKHLFPRVVNFFQTLTTLFAAQTPILFKIHSECHEIKSFFWVQTKANHEALEICFALCFFSTYSFFFLVVCGFFLVLGCSFFTRCRDRQEMKAWRSENADWNIGRRRLTRLQCVKYTWTYSGGPVTWAPSGSRSASWVIKSDISALETEGRRRGN